MERTFCSEFVRIIHSIKVYFQSLELTETETFSIFSRIWNVFSVSVILLCISQLPILNSTEFWTLCENKYSNSQNRYYLWRTNPSTLPPPNVNVCHSNHKTSIWKWLNAMPFNKTTKFRHSIYWTQTTNLLFLKNHFWTWKTHWIAIVIMVPHNNAPANIHRRAYVSQSMHRDM